MTWDKYHRLADIYDYMNYLQENYPDIAEVIDIGRSVLNRPMLLLKIGSKKFSDKPAIVIEAGKLRLSSFQCHFQFTSYHFPGVRSRSATKVSSKGEKGT